MIDLDARQGSGRRARRHDDVLRRIGGLGAVGARDGDPSGRRDAAETGGDVHPVLLHEVGNPVRALPDHLLLVLHRPAEVQVHLASGDSDVPAVAGVFEKVGRVQERYGIAKDEAERQVREWVDRM